MPPVKKALKKHSPQIPAATLRTLHDGLAAIGTPVSKKEAGTTPKFGVETAARLKAFQERYRLPVTGEVDPTTDAALKLAALVATEADPAVLRTEVTAAAAAGPQTPTFRAIAARAALLAGDYGLAASLSPHLTDLSELGINLGDGIFTTGDANPSPKAPEVPFPENFYSYRHDVMAQHDIDALRIIRDVPAGDDAKNALADSAEAFLSAIEAWQQGNTECDRQRYDAAVAAYDRCQEAALGYFAAYSGYGFEYVTGPLPARMDDLVRHLVTNPAAWADIANQINWRRQLLSLAELREFDWQVIVGGDPVYRADIVYQLLYANMKGTDQPLPPTGLLGPAHRKILMDTRLVVIAAVLVPLARAEANRLRRQSAAARDDLTRFLRRSLPLPDSTLTLGVWLACEFIEIPFARLLLVETMLDQAESQYKARASVDDEPNDTIRAADLARLEELAQDFTSRQIPGDAGNAARPFQRLVAAITYADIFEVMTADGEYVVRVRRALDTLHAAVTTSVANGDVTSVAFRAIGQGVTIPTLIPSGSDLPGLSSGTHPHEPYLQFSNPDPMRERNPRVYALLLQAQSRLLQIWNGCNYLGYRDDYVPPWRFNYLLERARYFTEHTKNAQRDYLNFLSNAESQEFKELSAAQNVELEKASVQIETARVAQASKEVAASKASVMQAQVNMDDAGTRLGNYREFDAEMSLFEDFSLGTQFVSMVISGVPGGSIIDSTLGVDKAWAERNLEKKNLELAVGEAIQAGRVALAKLDVDKAGLIVAGLQRQAALLRHEYALQNLQFMRNQALNTEQWYRLAGGIRSVADTYLRYAIELAFLAQQAYNFELDKRLNVIRFDYDQSEVGAMLAGDFVFRDLDTLEQDLLTSQQARQQQVRYVLSMAREFPETMQLLTDTGTAMFSLRLEQLERHFPGLVALRISGVDLQPVALMDPTRVAVELTHLGTGMVRLKGQPGNSPLNSSDLAADGDWIPNAGTDWPVKIHVSGPDTALFSGLSRQEAASLSSTTANERGAFEGLPGASSWRIDMSMKENQVVPGTLADVIISFTLSGYYDSQLRALIDGVEPQSFATTSFVSARRTLPDAYYSLVHDGALNWDVTERMLSLTGAPNELRNLAVLLPLAPTGPELGRCYCRYPVQVMVAAGSATIANAMPKLTLTPAGLSLACAFTGPTGTQVSWDFGDDTPLVSGLATQHSYARPGQYEVLIRLARDGRLVEYRGTVVVSAVHPPVAPLIVVPEVIGGALVDGTVPVTIDPAAGGGEVSIECVALGQRKSAASGSVTLKLPPGLHTIDFLATRKLSGRFYSKQCYPPPAVPVPLIRGRVATNRTFDTDGADNTVSPNAFATQLFGDGSAVVSPVDRWTFELPRDKNPWFEKVSHSDVAEFDCSELNDAVLSLEFMSR